MILHFTNPWDQLEVGKEINLLAKEWHERVEFLDLQIKDNNWNKNSWKDLWNHFLNKEICLLCESGLVVGFCLINHFFEENSIHLWKIVIDTKHRMRGLGGKLLEFQIKKYPGKTIYLEVAADNIMAIRFYESLAFKKVHFAKGFYSNGKDAWKMTRT